VFKRGENPQGMAAKRVIEVYGKKTRRLWEKGGQSLGVHRALIGRGKKNSSNLQKRKGKSPTQGKQLRQLARKKKGQRPTVRRGHEDKRKKNTLSHAKLKEGEGSLEPGEKKNHISV